MNKIWTEKELEYLHDNAGILSYEEMSTKLKRTAAAIRSKRWEKKFPTFYNSVITQSLLAQELGKSRTSIRNYVNKGWLQCKRVTWRSRYSTIPMIFFEKDIVRFLKKFYHLFDYRKIPNRYFSNIVKNMVML